MLQSIDSFQNRLSADQYDLSLSRAQVSTHRNQVFLKVIRWQVTSFQMIAASSLYCVYVPHNWPFNRYGGHIEFNAQEALAQVFMRAFRAKREVLCLFLGKLLFIIY